MSTIFLQDPAECHANGMRKGGFAHILDFEHVLGKKSIVVPGDPGKSELYKLLQHPDPDDRMSLRSAHHHHQRG